MKYEIIKKSWYKRRVPKGSWPNPVSVNVPDIKLEHNHICKMIVTFDNQTEKELISRVVYNELNNYWTVDGMEVSVKVIV